MLALFNRPLARALTNHADVQRQFEQRVLVRLLGEIASLLALVTLAQRPDTNLAPILGIVFAFFMPTVLLTDMNINRVLSALRLENTPLNHMATGAAGVLLLYLLFELAVRATSRDRTPPKPRDPAPASADGVDSAMLGAYATSEL